MHKHYQFALLILAVPCNAFALHEFKETPQHQLINPVRFAQSLLSPNDVGIRALKNNPILRGLPGLNPDSFLHRETLRVLADHAGLETAASEWNPGIPGVQEGLISKIRDTLLFSVEAADHMNQGLGSYWKDVCRRSLSGEMTPQQIQEAALEMNSLGKAIPTLREKSYRAAVTALQTALDLEKLGPGGRLAAYNFPGLGISADDHRLLDSLALGRSDREIASELGIPKKTMKARLAQRIFSKFKAQNRVTVALLWSRPSPIQGEPPQILSTLRTPATPALTEKYHTIIRLIIRGLGYEDIGSMIGTTEQVVKNYVNKIFDAFGVYSQLHLAVLAVQYDKFRSSAPKLENHIGPESFAAILPEARRLLLTLDPPTHR